MPKPVFGEVNTPVKKTRRFLPDKFKITAWDVIEPYFKDLKLRELNSISELENWLLDKSELEAVLEEDMAWRYIKMNIDTTDEELSKDFHFFVEEIQPKAAPYGNDFNKKLVECPHHKELGPKYTNMLREVKSQIEIYREENIPIKTKLSSESQKFGSINAKMSVEIDGEELTLQQAARYLKNLDRSVREDVYKKVQKRRLQDKDDLNDLFDKLIDMRQEIASNADFDNFRDYSFKSMGRFDYSPEDCYEFHKAIAEHIVPITNELDKERKEALELDTLRPWDKDVDITGKEPLSPFTTADELVEKTIACFNEIKPSFGECIAIMQEMGHLDLESKKGKAPGGFNYPLFEIGVPFIYMNSVGTHKDLVTMLHEGGHAIHSILTKDYEITDFKSFPSEVAELASMAMELMSMEHWDIIYDDEEELKRAKREQLHRVLTVLPWVATIDKFQHWIYTNKGHSQEDRYNYWLGLMEEFGSDITDWSGLEEEKKNTWQKQLHLYEVPFYYIEYGMAQLGAVAVWRNFKNNPEKAVEDYEKALSLGYTKNIGDIYKTAGVKFDFSPSYVKELASFVKEELGKI